MELACGQLEAGRVPQLACRMCDAGSNPVRPRARVWSTAGTPHIVGACEARDLLMDFIMRPPTLLPLTERSRGRPVCYRW